MMLCKPVICKNRVAAVCVTQNTLCVRQGLGQVPQQAEPLIRRMAVRGEFSGLYIRKHCLHRNKITNNFYFLKKGTTNMQKIEYTSFDQIPVIINAERLAMILGISRTTAYELMRSNAFPTFKVGSRISVRKDHLLAWMDKQAGIEPQKS